jgi:HD superfamily phosphohydrolase
MMPSSGTARKSIFDPVHGPVTLSGAPLSLIGTEEFQRLWGIRQTGFAHLVFPGANHTRLEHSLGTYWIAQQLIESLSLGTHHRALVEAGALLHDLGHPPFSHTLEPTMREVLGFGHERRSRQIIEGTREGTTGSTIPRILERAGLRPRDVADLVDPPSSNAPRPLLRSLLHGPVDADRIDYLERDAHYTGVAHGAIDAVRLFSTVRAHGGRVAFAAKGRHAVEGFLVGRSLMYSAVYYHKTVRAAELMAEAALERSSGYPEAAMSLLSGTDGDFLARLGADRSATSARLIRDVRGRRLLKQAFGWSRLDTATSRQWARLVAKPGERRALEEAVAERFHGPQGSILFDLAGLFPRDSPKEDGRDIALIEGTQVSYPFRDALPWRELATRPPTQRRVVVYSSPKLRGRVAHWLERDPRELP